MDLRVEGDRYDYNPYNIKFFSNTPADAEVDYSNIDFSLISITGSATNSYEPFLTSPPEDKTYELSSNVRKM